MSAPSIFRVGDMFFLSKAISVPMQFFRMKYNFINAAVFILALVMVLKIKTNKKMLVYDSVWRSLLPVQTQMYKSN